MKFFSLSTPPLFFDGVDFNEKLFVFNEKIEWKAQMKI